MAIKQKFTDLILKILVPTKFIFFVLSIINITGYWYYSYEQNLWIKVFLIIITVGAFIGLLIFDEFRTLATLNVFLTTRNLYFAFVDSYIDFKPLMVLCFLAVALIIYFSLEFEQMKQITHLNNYAWVYTLFGSLAITELFLLLSYWNNVPRPTKAILISITYYFLMRTIDIEDENEFNLKKLGYLFLITAVLITAVIYSISWKEI